MKNSSIVEPKGGKNWANETQKLEAFAKAQKIIRGLCNGRDDAWIEDRALELWERWANEAQPGNTSPRAWAQYVIADAAKRDRRETPATPDHLDRVAASGADGGADADARYAARQHLQARTASGRSLDEVDVRRYGWGEIEALRADTRNLCKKKFKAAFGIEWHSDFAKKVLSNDDKYHDYMEGIDVRERLRAAILGAVEYTKKERGSEAELTILREARDAFQVAKREAEAAEKDPWRVREVADLRSAESEALARVNEVEAAMLRHVPLGLGWFVPEKVQPLADHYFLSDRDSVGNELKWAGAYEGGGLFSNSASDNDNEEERLKRAGLLESPLQRFVYKFDTMNALGLPPRKDGSSRFFTTQEFAITWILAISEEGTASEKRRGSGWPEVKEKDWPESGYLVSEYLGKTTDAVRQFLGTAKKPKPFAPAPGHGAKRGPDTSE